MSFNGTHHVFLLDCSGSMRNSLSELRRHLKNNLATIVNPNDYITIIWFSGREEYGVVFEKQMLHDTGILHKVHASIDRWLQPKSLTGFLGPLELAYKLSQGSQANHLILQTDGHDNQSDLEALLKFCRQRLQNAFQTKTIIEYGYYCNRPLLTQMAKEMNASHQFCEDEHEMLCSQIDTSLVMDSTSYCKIDVTDRLLSANDRVMFLHNNNVMIGAPNTKQIQVPKRDTTLYFYDITSPIDTMTTMLNNLDAEKSTIQLIHLYVDHKEGRSDRVWDRVYKLGDVRLIRMFTNAFSKQELIHFEETLKECIFKPEARNVEGTKLHAEPNLNAYTILDFLNAMVEPNFNVYVEPSCLSNYKRITAGQKRKESDNESSSSTDTLVTKTTNEPFHINSLVFNEQRANVTLHLQRPIQVQVPEKAQQDFELPTEIPSKQHKSVSIICDGVVHFSRLVLYVPHTWKTHFSTSELPKDCIMEDMTTRSGKTTEYVIQDQKYVRIVVNLSLLPLINRSMIAQPLVKEDIALNYIKMLRCKAQLKVLKNLLQAHSIENTVTDFDFPTTEDSKSWLKTQGLTTHGFQIPSKTVKSEDYYVTREVVFKATGCMTLPTVAAILKKQKKPTLASTWMKETWDAFDGKSQQDLQNEIVNVNALKHQCHNDWVNILYRIIVGKTNFPSVEFEVDFEGTMIPCSVEIIETKVFL